MNIDIRENYIKDINNESNNNSIKSKPEESNSSSSNEKNSNITNEKELNSKSAQIKDSSTTQKKEDLFAFNQIENIIDLNFILTNENKIEENKKNLENLKEDNVDLGKLNEILEREINLLKSLILINNLNSTNNSEKENDQRQNSNKNYSLEMCNDNNLQELVQDDGLFKKHKTLHILMIKIKVFI